MDASPLKKPLKSLPERIRNSSLAPMLQSSLDLLEAQKHIEKGEYERALSLGLQIQAKIPKRKEDFRYIPEKGYSGLYTNSWRLIQECYKKLGKQEAAFSALVEIVSTYNKASKIKLETALFQEFIDYTNWQTQSYLKTARSLAQKYQKYTNEKSSKKGSESLSLIAKGFQFAKQGVEKGLSIISQKQESIELKTAQTLELDKLCQEFSQNNIMLQRLSPKYRDLYKNFCKKNATLFIQRKRILLPIEEFQKAVELFYGIAYSNARALNFFFFNITHLGFREEAYKESSIYFRRLEVDIIIEKTKELFHTLEENFLLELLTGEEGKYSSKNFVQIEQDYRLLFKQAILAQDLSMIYGYAYMLIKKNTSESSFYRSLEKKEKSFSSSFLQKRKKESLHELKNAEYLLRYILNVNPQHADAYLLLGWLLQYIDQGKKSIVKYQSNLWERLIAEEYNTEKDEDFYEDIYKIYFPHHYYEENVELYRQALQWMDTSAFPKETLGHLHLNLANNYFILNNFNEAAEHYGEALTALTSEKGRSEGNFESQQQRLLFYFNFARTLLYKRKYKQAIFYLKKCYSLYEEKEYLGLREEYKNVRFRLDSKARNALSFDSLSQNFSYFQNIKQQLNKTRSRLALIAALTGLAYWEAGDSKKAISYYHRADQHLYQEKPALPEVLSRSNLLNFLAIAYQDKGELENADTYARMAAQEAQESGLKRDEERYKAKDYCGKSMSCFLNFGEDFSVIGKGRNPYGFSPLRQYELALSIQLENMIRREEFFPAAKLIKKQQDIFYKHERDLKHGQRGYLNSLNREALNSYKAGKYQQAAASFLKAAQKAHDFLNMESYRINYANHFNSLLSWLAYSSPAPEEALSQIADALEEWDDFEEVYRDAIRKEFIAEKRQEFYAYSFDEERDRAILEERIQEGLAYMTNIKASFLYYDAHFRYPQDSDISLVKEEEKVKRLEKAIKLLKSLLEEIQGKENSLKAFSISCRYNLARLYFSSGDLYSARDTIEEALREAYEFHLLREEILLNLLASQIHEEIYTLYQTPENDEAALYHMENVLELFFSNPHHYESFHREAEKISKAAVAFYLRQGEEGQALQILEQSWALYLNWQYFRYGIDFSKETQKKLHESIRAKRKLHRETDEKKYFLRLEKKKTNEIEKAGEKLKKEKRLLYASLDKLLPRHNAFLKLRDWRKGTTLPDLAKGQLLMRFFLSPDSKLYLWCFSYQDKKNKARATFFSSTTSPANGKYKNPASFLIQKCLQSQKEKGKDFLPSDIFLIPSEELFSLDFYQIIKDIDPKLPAPSFATRLTENFLGKANFKASSKLNPSLSAKTGKKKIYKASHLHVFNAGPVPSVLDSYLSSSLQESRVDITDSELAELWKVGGKHKIYHRKEKKKEGGRIKGILESHPYLSLLLLKEKEKRHKWKELALLYEILRSYGVGTLAWEKEEDTVDIEKLRQKAGKEPYAQKGLVIFGFPGFDKNNIGDLAVQKYKQFSLRAKEAEEKNQYEKARQEQLLAASYLSWNPKALELSEEKVLAMLRLDILLQASAPSSHKEKITNLLRLSITEIEKKENGKEKEFVKDIYKTAIAAMDEAKLSPQTSLEYIEEWEKYFPSQEKELEEKRKVIEFLSRLSRKQYTLESKQKKDPQKAFHRDFARLYPYLKQEKDPRILEELIKHSQYNAASRLIQDWKEEAKDKLLQRKLREIELTILFARSLLEGLSLDFSLPILSPNSLKKCSPYLQMLYSAWQGNWKEYASFLKRLESFSIKREAKPGSHIHLYREWENFLKQHEVHLRYISEIPENESFSIGFIEKSLIYHLYLHTLSMDASNQNALFLDSFIKESGEKFSADYMAQTALYASEKYIERGDFFHALHFFDLYLKAEKNSIFSEERAYFAARLGIRLDSLGLRPNFVKYHAQWKKNLQKRTPSGNFILGLFEALDHGNTKKKIQHLGAQILIFAEMLDAKVLKRPLKERKEILPRKEVEDEAQKLLKELEIALKLLEWQALRKEEWSTLVNLSFLKSELEYFQTAYAKGLYSKAPRYQDYLSKLKRKILTKQSFVGLVDTSERILRFMFKKDDFHIFPLEHPAQSLRVKMKKYLRRRALGFSPYQKMRKELNLIYRNLPEGNPRIKDASRIQYLWLPGLHSLAPLSPRPGEKLFQVLDIQKLLDYPILTKRQQLQPNFKVKAIGKRQLKALSEKEKYLAKRIYTMEKLLFPLPKQENEKEAFSIIYHIFSNLDETSQSNFLSHLLAKEPGLVYSPSFISSNFLKIFTPKQIQEYNFFLKNLSHSFQAPGIIALQKPSYITHAYFLRYFYDKDSSLKDIGKRFQHAYHLTKEKGVEDIEMLDYRMFTSSFLQNE